MPKVLKQTFRKLWCLSACKKSISSTSFLRYCKDIANSLFWDFWECLTIPIKIIISICSKLICVQKINFNTQFFLKILRKNSKLVILGKNDNSNFKKPLTFICRQKIKFILQVFIKGGLSGRMTEQCFRVIFSLKKKTIQFPLSMNFYFQQKRALKLSICHLPTKRSIWVFDVKNRTNGFSNFQIYHEVVMHLFNWLAKGCPLFWKYSWTINRNNIFELTYK